MIQTYIIDWIFEATMLIMLLTASYRYVRMKPHTTRALLGLIAIVVLALPVIVGIAIAIIHPGIIDFMKTGLFNVVMFDIFVVMAIYQWTLLNMTTQDQRMVRRFFTGGAIFLGLVTLALLVYLHF